MPGSVQPVSNAVREAPLLPETFFAVRPLSSCSTWTHERLAPRHSSFPVHHSSFGLAMFDGPTASLVTFVSVKLVCVASQCSEDARAHQGVLISHGVHGIIELKYLNTGGLKYRRFRRFFCGAWCHLCAWCEQSSRA